jgi:hypothetical protein
MPKNHDLPANCAKRMSAARLLMSAATNLIATGNFSRINTARAIGDVYAALEELGMQDFSNDNATCNFRASTLEAADEIREHLCEVER